LALETASIPRMERHQRRRRRVKRFLGAALVLALVAAAAWGTWTYAIPHLAVIPEVIGQPIAQARVSLEDLGFLVDELPAEYSTKVPEGSVKLVRPAEGTEREVGTVVTLIPSLGPPPVAVPPIEGRLLKDARRLLEEQGFVVDGVKQRFDAKVPAGHVISRQPSDAELPMRSLVTLVVSKGARPLPVPDVQGVLQDAAVEALDEKGFEVLVEETFSAKVDRGRVIGTDPPSGTDVQPGETVVLSVSLGPEYFPCPDFVGMTVDAARALAERLGLRLSAVAVPGADGEEIVSQDFPEPGARVRYGTTVTVFYA
jgi:beta-lactam-binding protein with PASTA domain